MDENVKNDAKQVMLVQNADDGRLQAVTGVDRDGNIQTADPTDQNVASLLNVNTQDSALEAFFKKFMEQAQNPVHTGIFVMTENALNKLIRIDFDPEILENYRIDPSERLQTQEQRLFVSTTAAMNGRAWIYFPPFTREQPSEQWRRKVSAWRTSSRT